jgi:hypothetical protein
VCILLQFRLISKPTTGLELKHRHERSALPLFPKLASWSLITTEIILYSGAGLMPVTDEVKKLMNLSSSLLNQFAGLLSPVRQDTYTANGCINSIILLTVPNP